ncbi:MAG: D-alanyl-D-alanine carboxypeptidase, partial [Rhodospirillales bacterium]|nr:D-alanyl-D-alanine carboxypeptidase [Rhodospirillales bacterium]
MQFSLIHLSGQACVSVRAFALAIGVFSLLGGITAAVNPAQAKYASIVIDEKTGRVLHAVNPDGRHYPASLTKMMTLYLTFEALKTKRLSLDGTITMSRRAARQPASKLGLKAKKKITVRNAVMALIVKSANDIASAMGEELGGTERKFGYMMSAKAKALGMKNTSFRNASGLPNRRQLTTARDMATLLRALKRDFPQYYTFFKARYFTFQGRRHANHNRLLDRYAGTNGGKTGYIRASGFNLAVSAARSNIHLIGVTMGTRSPRARDLHMMGLLERGFEKATGGRYTAYDYDRNIHVTRKKRRIYAKIRVHRARGARGYIRLSRLTPPRRPSETPIVIDQGSAPAPKKASPTTRDALDNGPWAIQVGAFSRFAPAHLAASRALRRLPRMLHGTLMNIRPTREKSGVVYRARLIGLDRDRAHKICELLKTKNMSCVPITPQGKIASMG